MVSNTIRGGGKACRQAAFKFLSHLTARHADSGFQAQLDQLDTAPSELALKPLFELQGMPGAIPTAWGGLGAFAHALVRQRQPRIIVELGSFGGFSTCAMALALQTHSPRSRLYAVDTWQGDPHTGTYHEEVYQQFLRFRKNLGLEDIIVPLRMSFAAAKHHIPSPIELLHIDGWHTFSAVRRDFQDYQPLLAPQSLVLFHDVNTHFIGMRLFWLLASLSHPTALIPYSHGLGVLRWEKS